MAIGDSTTSSILALTDGRMMGGEKVLAAVVVRSALDINNKFDYSTSTMIAARFDPFDMGPKWAAQSYGPGQSVRLGDQPFLDNPVQAGRVEAPASAATVELQANAPLTVTSNQSETLIIGTNEVPTDIRFNVRQIGATPSENVDVTTGNVIGVEVRTSIATVGTSGLLLASAPAVSGENLSIGLDVVGDPVVILGGFGTLAGGTKFTF